MSVQPLPPVTLSENPAAAAWPPAPAKLGTASAPDGNRGGSISLSDSALGQQIAETIDDEEPIVVGRPVSWTALDAAQSTVPLGWYAGADYLLVRPRFSEPAAFLSGSGVNNQIDATLNTFSFDYQSSPRVFLGYRSPTTGSGAAVHVLAFPGEHFAEFCRNRTEFGLYPRHQHILAAV